MPIKKKIVTALSLTVTLAGFLGLLFFTESCLDGARRAIQLCMQVIIPSLFPFFVFSSLLTQSGLCKHVSKPLEKIMRPLFGVSGACSAAFLLGLLSGFPVGAKTAVTLYRQGLCTKAEAERTLAFCNNAGPFFILGTVGVGIWQSSKAGWLLWAAQAISAILTGMVFGHLWKKTDRSVIHPVKENSNAKKGFYFAVADSARAMLPICAFIIFFAVIVALLQAFGITSVFSHFLSRIIPFLSEDTAKSLISGFFEMTTGIAALGNGTPLVSGLTLTGALLGWAGLSVHCQVLSFVYESGLSTQPYFFGKLLQTAFSTAITYLFSIFISVPDSHEVFGGFYISGVSAMSPLTLFLICTAVSLILFFTLCLFAKEKNE